MMRHGALCRRRCCSCRSAGCGMSRLHVPLQISGPGKRLVADLALVARLLLAIGFATAATRLRL